MIIKISNIIPLKEFQASTQPVQTKSAASSGLGEMELSPGQILKGKVLTANQGGKVVLDVGGKIVAATSQTPLKPDSEVWLEVKQGGKTPWFSLADKKGAALEFLKLLLSEGGNVGKANEMLANLISSRAGTSSELFSRFELFFKWFASMSVSERPDAGAILGNLVMMQSADMKKSTGFFPDNIQEQLAGLSEAEHLFSAPAGKSLQSLDQLVKVIDLLNTFNSHTTMEKQPVYLFPCFFAGGAGWGEWMFSADAESEKDENGAVVRYNLDFFLSMSNLGDVEFHATVDHGKIKGDFFLNDKQMVDYVKSKLPELESMLEPLGYEHSRFQCRQKRGNMLQSIKRKLSEKIDMGSFSLLDIRA